MPFFAISTFITHEAGMKAAWTKAFNEYARKVGLLKDKDKNLEGLSFKIHHIA